MTANMYMMRHYISLGPMKGVIPTPDIAKIFHPTPDIKAKKMPDTRHSKFTPTLGTHLPKDGKIQK